MLQVDEDWLAVTDRGAEVTFDDTRGRHRSLTIVDRDRGGLWGELTRAAYATNGTRLERCAHKSEEPLRTEVSGIAAADGAIPLRADDLLVLTKEALPGRMASFDSAGRLLSPARVSCTLPEAFADVRAGERFMNHAIAGAS